jgi:hypothetical protein
VAWGALSGPSAAGARRALRHARHDLGELRDEGEALLHALMAADVAAVEAAAHAVHDLEARVVALGGLRPAEGSGLPG